jgi:hypothetical protein
MYDLSGELITIWWLQKLGKELKEVKKQHRSLIWKDLSQEAK